MSLVKTLKLVCLILLCCSMNWLPALAAAPPPENPQQGAIGVGGTITSPPPKDAPTISTPSNGQSFNKLPITIAGLCSGSLLIEIFKNGVFAGSTNCANNSYSLQIDLFDGKNDLIARAYDALNQASPDSATVSVTFSQALPAGGTRVFLTTAYAKRGAQPGSNLTWPLTLSGGSAPYAISVDWGDQTPAELLSQKAAGDFTIDHIYAKAGSYNVTVRATDSNGTAAFLQLVGIGNGPVQQQTGSSTQNQVVVKENNNLLIPLVVALVATAISFWLGKKHSLSTIRDNVRSGRSPF
jgi:hypothetical protein